MNLFVNKAQFRVLLPVATFRFAFAVYLSELSQGYIKAELHLEQCEDDMSKEDWQQLLYPGVACKLQIEADAFVIDSFLQAVKIVDLEWTGSVVVILFDVVDPSQHFRNFVYEAENHR